MPNHGPKPRHAATWKCERLVSTLQRCGKRAPSRQKAPQTGCTKMPKHFCLLRNTQMGTPARLGARQCMTCAKCEWTRCTFQRRAKRPLSRQKAPHTGYTKMPQHFCLILNTQMGPSARVGAEKCMSCGKCDSGTHDIIHAD
jgi:hypothetical protein